MPKRPQPFAALPMLKEAWFFFWKQPALLRVTVWMVGLTSFVAATLERIADTTDPFSQMQLGIFLQQNDPESLFVGFMTIILGLVSLWGMCGIVVVGRRMIGARSGRTRTSFSSVLNEGASFVRPVLFSELLIVVIILAPVFIFFAAASATAYVLHTPATNDLPDVGLLLFFVAFVFAEIVLVGTYLVFGPLSIVCDDKKTGRGALRYSYTLVRGKFWTTFKCILIFAIPSLLAGLILAPAIDSISPYDTWFVLAADFVSSVLMSILGAIFVLAMVLLYGKLRDAPKQVKL